MIDISGTVHYYTQLIEVATKTSLNHGFRFEHFYGGTTTSVVTTAPTTKSRVL